MTHKSIDVGYQNITISGKIATGTTTLAKNLQNALHWKYVNTGELQRKYDRTHNIHENKRGATARSDSHEKGIDELTRSTLSNEQGLIYEAWLSGFVTRDMDNIFRVLVVCSEPDIIIDRVVNRENISIADAKEWIGRREQENIDKWRMLYGKYNFWDPRYYSLVIDTYKLGPMESLGRVLDTLGVKNGIGTV